VLTHIEQATIRLQTKYLVHAAVISAVCELSERSIKQKGAPQKFPNFTRGMWKKNRELHVMES
jgi:hypothetical protein